MNVKDCTVMPPTTPVHPTPILLIAVMPSSCRLSDKNVMKHRDLNSAKTLTVIGLPSRSSNTDAKKRLWNPGRHTCGDPQTSTYRSYTYTFKPFSIVTTSNKILCDPMASYVILCPVFKDKSWPPNSSSWCPRSISPPRPSKVLSLGRVASPSVPAIRP